MLWGWGAVRKRRLAGKSVCMACGAHGCNAGEGMGRWDSEQHCVRVGQGGPRVAGTLGSE